MKKLFLLISVMHFLPLLSRHGHAIAAKEKQHNIRVDIAQTPKRDRSAFLEFMYLFAFRFDKQTGL